MKQRVVVSECGCIWMEAVKTKGGKCIIYVIYYILYFITYTHIYIFHFKLFLRPSGITLLSIYLIPSLTNQVTFKSYHNNIRCLQKVAFKRWGVGLISRASTQKI